MENEKIRGIIICADKLKFINKKTGEVSYMTKISYTMPREQTSKTLGHAFLDSYNKEEVFDYLAKNDLFGKMCDIELSKMLDGNRIKLKIVKINNYVLS